MRRQGVAEYDMNGRRTRVFASLVEACASLRVGYTAMKRLLRDGSPRRDRVYRYYRGDGQGDDGSQDDGSQGGESPIARDSAAVETLARWKRKRLDSSSESGERDGGGDEYGTADEEPLRPAPEGGGGGDRSALQLLLWQGELLRQREQTIEELRRTVERQKRALGDMMRVLLHTSVSTIEVVGGLGDLL